MQSFEFRSLPCPVLRAEPANSLVGAALRALDLDRTGPVIYLLERSRRLQPDVRGSNWDLSLTERVFVPNQRIEALRGLRKEQVMDDHASSPRRRSGAGEATRPTDPPRPGRFRWLDRYRLSYLSNDGDGRRDHIADPVAK